MLESIYIGMSGLLGYSRGLRVIANDTANMNTPGFKGSNLQFSDLCYPNGGGGGGNGISNDGLGYGLNTGAAELSFKQGELSSSSNDLDVAVDGLGLFVLKDEKGNITYTRAGQFQFDTNGILVSKTNGNKVMGYDAAGNLAEISDRGLATNPGKATVNVKFSGNLSSTATDQTVSGVKVVDALGSEHTLSLKFTNTSSTTPGSWNIDLIDGSTVVSSGQIIFQSGAPTAATAKVALTYSPAGSSAMPMVFDFSTDVTSYAAGSTSSLAMASQDGYKPGGMTKASFDETGTLVLTYANSQTVKGTQLALARFDSLDSVVAIGNNQFGLLNASDLHLGTATTGAFGKVRSATIELSNVDLSQELGDLVVMQRGYQASSQIVSTANEMLQELFSMKGKG